MEDRKTIEELAADNRRLRQLLDERHLPSELRHRQRSTLALLRAVVQQGQHQSPDVEAYAGHLLDRLDAIAWAQSTADDRGDVDFHTLIAERLRHFNVHEGPTVQLLGPEVRLTPRAGQYLALAVQELATNAIEHGPLGASSGALTIEWSLLHPEEYNRFRFVWTETGGRPTAALGEPGVGTSMLVNMLNFEFGAATTMDIGPDSFQCDIAFPWQHRFGTVLTADR